MQSKLKVRVIVRFFSDRHIESLIGELTCLCETALAGNEVDQLVKLGALRLPSIVICGL